MFFQYGFPEKKGINRYIQAGKKWVKGDPIDVFSGQVVEQRTDFSLGQTIELAFVRTWARTKESDRTHGLCGQYWVDNFSEYAEISQHGQHIRIATQEGTYLRFGLPVGTLQSFNPDHPQYTLIRESSALVLYNRDTGLRKIFASLTSQTAPDIALGYPALTDGIFPICYWQDEFENRVEFGC
ncbi:hypothetical protein RO21_08190 [[Actinobacillus] muris]|uniref:DUF6531 domain-containing protein n=1 Tax=Muribacter muris TaxID=67855 RepID=A0A0J5S2R7_9PAST|nr:DUF6531 domain-containing protein [Muribacter muris]KMK51097.1 hypothetical protein RO21_08190 [[Actinobacillus] muris] [Muribacter muris]